MPKNIAIVVLRYGKGINGGAESHAMQLAQHLNPRHRVTVLTTTAFDNDWTPHYPVGTEVIDGITVRRFPSQQRNAAQQELYLEALINERKDVALLKPSLRKYGRYLLSNKLGPFTQVQMGWLKSQGPYTPELIQYLRQNKRNYDVFIFFTYLYYPTVVGIEQVAKRAMFIPTAHAETPFYTDAYRRVFARPKFIMYNTKAEHRLVTTTWPNACRRYAIAGVGIEENHEPEVALPQGIRAGEYFFYLGRIEEGKGCKMLIDQFIIFLALHPQYGHIKLVLTGRNFIKTTLLHPNILYTGFVEEPLKIALLKNAKALIIPSFYESLSLVTLEAMINGVPVIANAQCEVLADHINDSGTGMLFYEDLTPALLTYLQKSKAALEEEGQKAKQYVAANYSWAKVIEKFEHAFSKYF